MKSAGWKWIGFICLGIFQWYILGSWIYREEKIISKGVFIKIPCRQMDPKDPFRGTYLSINPIPAQFEFEDSLQYVPNQPIWINYFQDDGEIYGFHSVQPVTEPPKMPIYIQSRIKYVYPVQADSLYTAIIEYPFSNLYINEKAAPHLTEEYNKALSDTTKKVYAGLFVLNGRASLEGLWIDNQKLE